MSKKIIINNFQIDKRIKLVIWKSVKKGEADETDCTVNFIGGFFKAGR
jgi:hypothetical protein